LKPESGNIEAGKLNFQWNNYGCSDLLAMHIIKYWHQRMRITPIPWTGSLSPRSNMEDGPSKITIAPEANAGVFKNNEILRRRKVGKAFFAQPLICCCYFSLT